MRIEDLCEGLDTSLIKRISLESLEKKGSFSTKEKNFVGKGAMGIVYFLNEMDLSKQSLVGKFIKIILNENFESSKYFSWFVLKLFHEYEIQKELYESGISVPKPFGVYSIKNTEDSNYYPGFIMRYIPGKNLWELPISFREKIYGLRDLELNKARDLGFKPGRDIKYNFIWVPEEEKVYLIDFNFWRKK